MQRIAIAGSQEFAQRLIEYFEGAAFGNVIGLFDDFEPPRAIKGGRPVLGPLATIPEFFARGEFDSVAIGAGYRHRDFRKQLFEQLKARAIPVTTFIHPSANIAPSATILEGAIVLVDCTVDLGAEVHENVLLSSRCFVSHHAIVRAHTFCAPAVNLAGHTDVGEGCFLGIATTTIDGVCIGERAQTGAGAVVVRDVPPGMLVAGVPAEVKRAV
jgi:acetyltransferase EpsM